MTAVSLDGTRSQPINVGRVGTLVSILVILTIFHGQIFEYLTYQDLDWFFIRSLKDLTTRYPRIRSYEISCQILCFLICYDLSQNKF